MAHIAEGQPTRVRSRDGAEIAFWTSGDGPPLVLVHGTTADHTRWRPLLPYLDPLFTVHAVDRRGRGGSGDGPDYDIAREYEDLAAVIDAVAATAGLPVDVYGHSYGGFCAFGAANLTINVRRMVVYEGWPALEPDTLALPPAVEERLEALLAAGEREALVEEFLREALGMDDEQVHRFRSQPSWAGRVAAAHTIVRESRADRQLLFDPRRVAGITVPVLLLVGEQSAEVWQNDVKAVAGALPDARIGVLEGQEHVADALAPELVARHLLAFLREP
jgi:pimeloyl-ACP methyl ester carboxylesterase